MSKTATLAEARKAWLDGLKPGDEVVISRFSLLPELAVFDCRTPAGILVVRNRYGVEEIFSPDGRGEKNGRYFDLLGQPTAKLREIIEARKIASSLKEIEWWDLPLPSLRRIAEVVFAEQETARGGAK